jgi:hypothetical protein
VTIGEETIPVPEIDAPATIVPDVTAVTVMRSFWIDPVTEKVLAAIVDVVAVAPVVGEPLFAKVTAPVPKFA